MITIQEPTREPGVGAAALVLTAGGAVGAIASAEAGGWWWILFAVLLLFTATAAYGTVDSFQFKHRAPAQGGEISAVPGEGAR